MYQIWAINFPGYFICFIVFRYSLKFCNINVFPSTIIIVVCNEYGNRSFHIIKVHPTYGLGLCIYTSKCKTIQFQLLLELYLLRKPGIFLELIQQKQPEI